jgi:hypothetical protein
MHRFWLLSQHGIYLAYLQLTNAYNYVQERTLRLHR